MRFSSGLIAGVSLLVLAVGCSDEDPSTPNNDGVVDEVYTCSASVRDYTMLEGRYPFAGEERFYRLDDTFCDTTDSILAEVDDDAPKFDAPVAMISPHAGWQYSGIVTAQMLSQIEVPDLVILIGNNHKNNGESYAVYPEGDWAYPFGDVPVDATVASKLIADVDLLVGDTLAHSEEHSNEVQALWLSRFNPDIRIVPIAVDNTNDVDELLELGQAIGNSLKELDEPFFVVMTTDLTHYESVSDITERDAQMVEQMVAFDPRGLFELVQPQRSVMSMCGLEPVVVGMEVARTLGATKAELVMQRTSADRNNNSDNAVGYAGVMLH